LLLPFMPNKAAAVLDMLGAKTPGNGELEAHAPWRGEHGLKAGQPVAKGAGLFMRADTDEQAPTA
jgi:hypothetical protein